MASVSLVAKTSNKTPLLKLLINIIIIVSHLFPLTWLISATLINRETEKKKNSIHTIETTNYKSSENGH